ncbi:MAG: hypothetical protein LIP06_07315 [Tannerellaceae bacterium]|nr:hypothetical protein [Tannerellaceae bacterium]
MKLYIQIALAAILVMQTACSDFLTGEDSKYTTEEQLDDILERNPDAIILGVYARSIQYAYYKSQHDDFGQKSIDISVDISAQDMVHLNMISWFRKNYWMEDRTATTDRPGRQWKYCYANIRDLNDFLARVPREELEELGTDLQRMRGGKHLRYGLTTILCLSTCSRQAAHGIRSKTCRVYRSTGLPRWKAKAGKP